MPLRKYFRGADVNIADLPPDPRQRRTFYSALYAFLGLWRECNAITTDFFEEKSLNLCHVFRCYSPFMANLCSIDVLHLAMDPKIVITWLFSAAPEDRTLVIEKGSPELYRFLVLLDTTARDYKAKLNHSITVLINSHFTLQSWRLLPHQIARMNGMGGGPSCNTWRTATVRFNIGSILGRSLKYEISPYAYSV